MNNSLTKHPGIVITTLIVAVLIIWGFWPKPLLVETTQVKMASLAVTIEEDGRTRVIDRYQITSPVSGVTCSMHLKVGDTVSQGQKLLGITPLASPVLDSRSQAQAKAQVLVAKSALKATQEQAKAANAAAKLAEDEYQRYLPLLQKGLISQDNLDKAKTTALTAAANKRTAAFQVDVAQHELEAALTTLNYASSPTDKLENQPIAINSPIDGKILKVERKCEGPVMTGEALLEVGNPQALEVEVDVLSADAVRIKPGMKVLFDRWGGDKPLEGTARLIEPVGFTKISALGVEEQRVWIISEFSSPIEQWKSLGDGYRVEAKFILWQQDDVLQIPSSALFRYQDGWAVFAIENNQAKRKIVEVGQRNGLTVQILAGLVEDEKIINHPSDAVEHGVTVEERLTH